MGTRPEAIRTLVALLKYGDVPHLFSTLNEKITVEEIQSRAAANRPLFLSHIRSLGVERLSDRQALANLSLIHI